MKGAPHRSKSAAALDRIAELELVRDGLARKLADAIAECEQLRAEVARGIAAAEQLAGAS